MRALILVAVGMQCSLGSEVVGPGAVSEGLCEASPRWWRADTNRWNEPSGFQFAPDGERLLRLDYRAGRVVVYRSTDGAIVRDDHDRSVLAVDAQWQWAVEARGTMVAVVGFDTPTVRFARGSGLDYWREEGWSAAAFSDDGEWVLALACNSNSAWLARFRSTDGTLDPRLGVASVSSSGCDAARDHPLRLVPDADGRGAVIAERARGILIHSQSWMSLLVAPHRDPSAGRLGPFDRGPALLGFDRRRATDAVASVGAGTGLLIGTFPLWSPRSDELIPVGVATVPGPTGASTQVSPVAWGHRGTTLVHVAEGGDIAIRDVARRRVVQSLDLPSDGGQTPIPLAFAVAADGRSLAVSFDRGVALWNCNGL